MTRLQDIRNNLSMLVYDLPNFTYKLNASGKQWLYITNRNERFTPAIRDTGVSMLDDFTSQLKIANHFPALSSRLFKKACAEYPFSFNSQLQSTSKPEFSFIIGHRGNDKIRNLNLVLQSIAAQHGVQVECIVVEQSTQDQARKQLPDWVRYYHQKVDESDLYSRSSAFNYGASKAQADNLVLHDNDLLIPQCYAQAHKKFLEAGYDLVNLKRYIFGLSQVDTRQLESTEHVDLSCSPEYILQNAKGGGSLVIKKSAYAKIGGFDDRFSGWGGEDNELWQRAQILNIYPFAYLPMIHLWHQPQQDKRAGKHGGGLHTEELIDELSAQCIYERINHLTQSQSC